MNEREVFAAVLPHCTAHLFSEKIRTLIPTTISAAVSDLDTLAWSARELLETAERSLYAASAGEGV